MAAVSFTATGLNMHSLQSLATELISILCNSLAVDNVTFSWQNLLLREVDKFTKVSLYTVRFWHELILIPTFAKHSLTY